MRGSIPFLGLVLTGLLATLTLPAVAVDVNVPGTSNPWLAGMPDGSTASINDVAPDQSPVLVSGLTLIPGAALTFLVTGSVNNTPDPSGLTPDGSIFIEHDTGAENGIADVVAPINSLVGVFLDDSQPDSTSAPSGLDFSALGLDFTSLAPGLKQVFFIGDGQTGDGVTQQFFIPAGAKRLFLGTMDGYEWNNNFGSFDVTITSITSVPEPGAISLLFGGLTGAALPFLRRKRRSA
jgi:hypothetical protein